jgi:ComF family protein
MGVLDLILPPACAGCGRYGEVLCAVCRGRLRSPATAVARFLAADAGVVVGDALEVAMTAFAYEGVMLRALGRLKYGGAARLARPLAEAALPAFDELVAVIGPGSLVPVPVHPERQRQRGYNQAALIANVLGRARSRPVRDILERRRATTQQHRLDRGARLRNLCRAFVLAPGASPPRVAILVDDILTTSATLEACAMVLRDAGSERVIGFAVAREV